MARFGVTDGRLLSTNRISGILAYVMAGLIFIVGALIAARAVDLGFVVYTTALAVLGASFGPFLIVAGRILNRRRELYTDWRIRNGMPAE